MQVAIWKSLKVQATSLLWPKIRYTHIIVHNCSWIYFFPHHQFLFLSDRNCTKLHYLILKSVFNYLLLMNCAFIDTYFLVIIYDTPVCLVFLGRGCRWRSRGRRWWRGHAAAASQTAARPGGWGGGGRRQTFKPPSPSQCAVPGPAHVWWRRWCERRGRRQPFLLYVHLQWLRRVVTDILMNRTKISMSVG